MKITHTLNRLWFLAVLIGCLPKVMHAQTNKWNYDGQFNFGAQVFLYGFFKHQTFPGLRAYAGFSARAIHGDVLLSYGPSISVYTKTIGANLNPLVADWQVDFTNSFSVGGLWGTHLTYQKFMRTVHTGDYYNLALDRRGAFIVSTNFILNSHHRNQILGSFNINFDKFTLNYYNDGGPPFNWLPLADLFDRYWTGGGGFFIHSKKGYNVAEFGFDQFTGYNPLLYEVANIVGIKVPLYDGAVSASRDSRPPNFNTSTYHLRINLNQNFGIDAGVVGSLVDNSGRFWGVQDLIHMAIKNSLHPNNDANRFFLGGSYNNFQHVKL
jgi:hypothetical protein